ncbi:MAG: hypothetical protein JW910_10560 [Anaerolineae bacterium]|nr:hypothetical protein [Anaerolineae bacterium]
MPRALWLIAAVALLAAGAACGPTPAPPPQPTAPAPPETFRPDPAARVGATGRPQLVEFYVPW